MLPTHSLTRRATHRLVGLLAIAGFTAAFATSAVAQAKLDSPLHIVVGYAPGGATDRVARVVADKLGIPMEDISIEHGDTGKVLFGMGTYGSRSLAVGGTAIVKALDKVIAKGKKIAAHLMEAADTDVEFTNGVFQVAGTDKSVPFASG
eukprot:gene2282-3009_t